ncbi:MAG: DUF882 domain-containing protein [Alphaproteobacteria bacterium]|jgi:uncharacterized protein YcbK (DUF882 family)|nr:DUF882 domain-containing protein [Alphaproteobacteria bacterium]MCB1551709.1 DUF882 domain-containing protein [Alphaproteobacteria bacterium]MCB9984493.1 DUF882 domain-containing protein [Micavibrio sp.]HPQ50488.1 DUF882 domain-containing protein [Alphaproteobacteria bacterium]HRK97742.1 DUF882 domain-containing protein [Alphaproteobacteria bacterium]
MSFLDSGSESLLSRRSFLKGGLTLSMSALISASVKPALAMPSGGAYNVSFKNSHTGEVFSGVYRVGNKYLPEAFERINYVMRDFRANEVFPMDPRAIDIISAVHRHTGTSHPYSVISGYRSPHTNAMLRSHSRGVAKRSLHMSGQAIDVRLQDVNAKHIREIATNLKAGGVGYYARQGFVHMDSGEFRTW